MPVLASLLLIRRPLPHFDFGEERENQSVAIWTTDLLEWYKTGIFIILPPFESGYICVACQSVSLMRWNRPFASFRISMEKQGPMPTSDASQEMPVNHDGSKCTSTE